MTHEGPIGRDAMRKHYEQAFFGPNGGKPRPLRFERITVRPLGDDHALMTGRFVLGGDGKPDQSGLVHARMGLGPPRAGGSSTITRADLRDDVGQRASASVRPTTSIRDRSAVPTPAASASSS